MRLGFGFSLKCHRLWGRTRLEDEIQFWGRDAVEFCCDFKTLSLNPSQRVWMNFRGRDAVGFEGMLEKDAIKG